MVLVDERDLFEEEPMLGSPQSGTGFIDTLKNIGKKIFGTIKEIGKKILPALLPAIVDVLSGKGRIGGILGSQRIGGVLPGEHVGRKPFKFPRLRIDRSGRLIRGSGLKVN